MILADCKWEIVIGARGWRWDAGLTNQCLNKEVLQENRGNGKDMEHMGGCPSLYLKKVVRESFYPELRLRLSLSITLVKT